MTARLLGMTAALLLALLSAGAIAAEKPGEARQWLEKMIQAAHSLSYEGIFVYVRGQQLEAMHVIHQNSQDGERQRMFSLNGSFREVVVANDQVICLNPEQQPSLGTGYRRTPFPNLPGRLDELTRYYDLKPLGEDRVAGMDAYIITIQPRDKLRFGYRLWLERNSGMVLRSALFDESDNILEQMMFTSVQFNPPVDPALLAPPASSTPTAPSPKPALEQVDHPGWRFAEGGLPLGFTRVMHNRLAGDGNRPAAEHIVLTDGLATVSVFLEPLQESKPLLQGPAQMGAMNAFGKVLDDYQVLAVGEVPQATVQMIVSALQPVPAAADK